MIMWTSEFYNLNVLLILHPVKFDLYVCDVEESLETFCTFPLHSLYTARHWEAIVPPLPEVF